jgi:ribose transport system ATP-binding protein
VFDREPVDPGAEALSLKDVRTFANPAHAVSLSVRRGEIVGLAGLVGAGRTELLRTIFGLDRPLDGVIERGGRVIDLASPGDAMKAGIAFVPEDRKADGLLLEESIRTNSALANLRRISRGFLTNRQRERALARDLMHRLDVQAPGETSIVGGLSGGNQQKVVLGRWLARDPEVLLLDEPTRGVDIGAKEEIYRLMDRIAENGGAILFASSEMEELISLADRVCVLHEGRLAGTIERDAFDEERIMHLATGGES